uniref:Uncharacterized protein n=1 Tax=Angiostrongylus cantonensis TaxID=6313 RepID=A0A0K0DG94_ANGCA
MHVAYTAVAKFCESQPSPTPRRDEKIRSIARSVQEIPECEEENEPWVGTSRDPVRPFILVNSPFTRRRYCPTHNSPVVSRKSLSTKLSRGLSDPDIYRPNFTVPSFSPKCQRKTKGLQPILEALSPVASVPSSTAKPNDVKDNCAT